MHPSGWSLDSEVTHLNHGAFGAIPHSVMTEKERWSALIERNPHRFFVHDLQRHLDDARRRLAAFLGTGTDGLAFVRNATSGVNAVIGSIPFEPGDSIVITDHEYNACANVVNAAAERHHLEVVVVEIPLPVTGAEEIVDRVVGAVTSSTRLAMIDWVTSPTAVVMPVEEVVAGCNSLGVPVVVDAAHAPGMVPMELDALGAAYVAGNLHKWLCAPRGAGFLWIRPDLSNVTVPPVISHGWNDPSPDRSRFHKLFDWTGTDDPTSWLAVPAALQHLTSGPGGSTHRMRRNHELVIEARDLLVERFGFVPTAPTRMTGSMAGLIIPPGTGAAPSELLDPLTATLSTEWQIEVPVFVFPEWPSRIMRISAQTYNTLDDYERLADALVALL